MKKYPVAERFTSLQGEGLYTGTQMHFIRFAGCSVGKKLTNEEKDEWRQKVPGFGGVKVNMSTGLDETKELPIYTEKCCTYDGREFLCFVSGTKIPVVSDGKYLKKKAVGKLRKGDRVLAWTKEGTVASKILRVENRWVPESFLVTVLLKRPSGSRVFLLVTKDHRFLDVDYRWVRADKLTLDHQLHHGNQQYADVTRQLMSDSRKKAIEEGRVTFNFSESWKRKASRRMKEKNPMKDSSVVAKSMRSHWRRPTGPEKKVIEIAKALDIDLVYTGANGKLIKAFSGKIRNPDFVVRGTSKVVEVYDSSFKYVGGRRDSRWVRNTKRWYSQCGYDCLVLDVFKASRNALIEKLVQFVGNGLSVKKIQEGIGGRGRRSGYNHRWGISRATAEIRNGVRFILVTELQIEHGNYLGPAGVVSHNCDTDFRTKEVLTTAQILDGVPKGIKRICLTGGEPLNQPLSEFLKFVGGETDYQVHIETSGTVSLTEMYPEYDEMDSDQDNGWLWITVSPKKDVLPEMIGLANEIKLLVDENFDVAKIPEDILDHDLVWLQPINEEWDVNMRNVSRCLLLLQEHPKWRLSMQMHKIWKVR